MFQAQSLSLFLSRAAVGWRLFCCDNGAGSSAQPPLQPLPPGLDRAPHIIESYDVSHTQGYNCTGSCDVFWDDQPAPKLYRSFNVCTVKEGMVKDFWAVREVLQGRFDQAIVANNGDSDVDLAFGSAGSRGR